MYNSLFSILIILVFVLLIKLYIESNQSSNIFTSDDKISSNNKINLNNQFNHTEFYNDANSYNNSNAEFNKMLEEVQKDTLKKINKAVEQGYAEGFQALQGLENYNSKNAKKEPNVEPNVESFVVSTGSEDQDITQDDTYTYNFNVKSNKHSKIMKKNINKNNNDNIISYLNKDNSVKLMLFYKPSCHYCSEFMPIWYKIINNLSNNVMYEDIDCESDYKTANEYQIVSVPTIILLVNNEKKIYMGDRSYPDIIRFLKNNGVNLVKRTFEEFDSTGYDITTTPTGYGYGSGSSVNKKTLCPSVTFDSQLDIAKDDYMFQIFNADGQYGYAVGGNNPGKVLTPFNAAYSTIDSYLTSLPKDANISECANSYSSQIRSFGLCDKDKLDNILQYQTNVSQGNSTPRFDGTDYTTNNSVVTAIKNSCGL